MAFSTKAGRATKAHGATPIWEATRRIAYDADEEEDQISIQSTQQFSNPQSQRDLIESIQSMARNSPRLNQNKPRTERQPQRTSTNQDISASPRRENGTNKLEASTSSSKVDAASDAVSPTRKQTTSDPDDDWIICEPYDEERRWFQGYYGRFHKASDGVWCFTRAPKQPEGSIGHRPKKAQKPKTKFMDLPPEIRNTIYAYAVPERSVLIVRSHPKKEAQISEGYWSEEYVTRKPYRPRLRYEPEWNYTSDDFGNVTKLMLTCKQIKSEVESLFYSRIQFCFHSLKSLRSFLQRAPKGGIQAIRSIYIRQDGYGNSHVTEYQKYRERYYQGWEETCTQLGQMALNLQHLKLKVYDREWPCVLSGKDYTPAWGEAIMKSAPALLPKVEVRIYHKMIDRNQEVLKDLARRVEDSMMTKAGRDERDRVETEYVFSQIAARKAAKEKKELQRIAKLNAPPPPTELVISMDDIQKQVSKTSVATNKVRNKGLDKFHKIERGVYNFDVEQYN